MTDVLRWLVGDADYEAYVRVKLHSMGLADAYRKVIANDLSGMLPVSGKQFVTTALGLFRIAPGSNSDNTTEIAAHEQMRAVCVQVVGDVSEAARKRGVISVEELYSMHGSPFEWDRFLMRVEAVIDA